MALDEQLLDDAEGLAGADPSGSLRALASAGAQVRVSMRATAEAEVSRLVGDGRPGRWWWRVWADQPWSATCWPCWPAVDHRCP